LAFKSIGQDTQERIKLTLEFFPVRIEDLARLGEDGGGHVRHLVHQFLEFFFEHLLLVVVAALTLKLFLEFPQPKKTTREEDQESRQVWGESKVDEGVGLIGVGNPEHQAIERPIGTAGGLDPGLTSMDMGVNLVVETLHAIGWVVAGKKGTPGP